MKKVLLAISATSEALLEVDPLQTSPQSTEVMRTSSMSRRNSMFRHQNIFESRIHRRRAQFSVIVCCSSRCFTTHLCFPNRSFLPECADVLVNMEYVCRSDRSLKDLQLGSCALLSSSRCTRNACGISGCQIFPLETTLSLNYVHNLFLMVIQSKCFHQPSLGITDMLSNLSLPVTLKPKTDNDAVGQVRGVTANS